MNELTMAGNAAKDENYGNLEIKIEFIIAMTSEEKIGKRAS
jgi:hypothetical protein